MECRSACRYAPADKNAFDWQFHYSYFEFMRSQLHVYCFLSAARNEHADLQVHFVLPFFLWKGSKKHLGAIKALEHRLLRPLISELRSEVTCEATGSLRGHFKRNSHSSGAISQPLMAPSFLLHSLVVKVLDFGARGPRFESHLWQIKNFSQYRICKLIFNAPHAYILLPYSPQILQGHCPLVWPPPFHLGNKEGTMWPHEWSSTVLTKWNKVW